MAKRFFFVCAGLFLIVGAYALGARSAVASGGGAVVCAGMEFDLGGSGLNDQIVVIGRNVYSTNGGIHACASAPIPGSSPVIACGGADFNGIGVYVILEDGSMFVWRGTWVLEATFPTKPTATTRESWGQLKVRYR